VLTEALLLGKLLVEAEHGTLLLAVDIASSATACGEVGVGWWGSQLDKRCWARGAAAVGDVRGLDASGITGAATTSVVDVGGGDGRVGLGDVVGRHFEGGCGVEV